jgi:hypothetical protein
MAARCRCITAVSGSRKATPAPTCSGRRIDPDREGEPNMSDHPARPRIRSSDFVSVFVLCGFVGLALVACRADEVPTIGSEVSPTGSPHGPPTAADLLMARGRFLEDPPAYRGTFEYRTEGEPTWRYDLLVDWPAFRLVLTFESEPGETVIATRDGERFGYRDAASGEVGITDGFGEGAFVLAPLVGHVWSPESFCPSEEIVGQDEIIGISTIHVRCREVGQVSDSWVDLETGLVLRTEWRKAATHATEWSGFVDLALDPVFDEGLFDPRSV